MIDAGKAVAYLDLDMSGYRRGIAAAKQLAGDLGSSTLSASSKVKALGSAMASAGKMASGLSAVLLSAGTAAAGMSINLDTSARKVATIADSAVLSLKGIKDETRALGAQLGVLPNQLNEALYNTISATNDTASAMGTVEIATKAAVGGFTNAATAVDGLTTVTNAYGLKGTAAIKAVSDQMLTAQNYGKTTFGEIAGAIGNVIPLAAQLRVGTNELFASIAALTRQGIGTNESITGLKAAFSNIIKPTADAQKAAKALGIDFSATALQSKGLAGFLAELAEKTGGDTAQMSKLFGSVEALNAVLALTGKDGAKYLSGALDAMTASAGATDKAFEMMTGGAQGALDRIKVLSSNIATSFGDILLPTVEQLLGRVEGMLQGFQALSPELQNNIVTVAAWVAAVGPALLIGGKLVTMISGLVSVMSGPVGWITLGVAGIAALTAGLDAMAKSADTVGNTVNRAFDGLDKQRVSEIAGKIQASVSVEVTGGEAGLQAQIDAQYQAIIDKLKTGGVVTAEDAKAVNDRVNGLIDTAMAGVDITANARITQLQAQLDSGVIDASTYKQQCDQIIADAEATKQGLEAVRTQSKTTVDGLIGDASTTADDAAKALGKVSEAAGEAVKSVNGIGDMITIGSIYDVIRDKLTDGKADTDEQTQSLSQMIDDWVAGEKAKIEAAVNGQIAALDINSADYSEQVAAIQSEGAQMMAALDEVQRQSVDWLIYNSGRATSAVEADMGKLDAIERRAMEVSARIEQATQAEKTIQQKNVERVKRGEVRDEGTITQTVGTVYSDYKGQKSDIETRRQQAVDELNASDLSGEAYKAAAQAIEDQYAAENQNLLAAYQQNLSELLAGIAAAYPEYSKQITDAQEQLDLSGQMQDLIDQVLSPDFDPSTISDKIMEQLLGNSDLVSPEQVSDMARANPEKLAEYISDAREELERQANEVLKGGDGADFGILGELLAGMIQAGMFEGLDSLDMTDGEAKLAAMVGGLGEGVSQVEVPVAPTFTVAPEVDASQVPGAVEQAAQEATTEPVTAPVDVTVVPGEVDASQVGAAVEQAAQEAGGGTITTETKISTNTAAEGASAGAEYAQALAGTARQAGSAANQVGSAAVAQLNGFRSGARTAGTNVGAGFVAGIRAKISAARTAGYQLGAASVQGVNEGADNHSPSRAGRLAGALLGDGYILGIQSKIAQVRAASKALGSAGLTGLGAQLATGGIDPALLHTGNDYGPAAGSGGRQGAPEAAEPAGPGITLNIHNPVVRSDRDIVKLSRDFNRYSNQISRAVGGRRRL